MIGAVARRIRSAYRHTILTAQVSTSGDHLRVLGYGKPSQAYPKRALLLYLTSPIERQLRGEKFRMFSTDGLATSIPAVLNQAGYLVDIVDYNDTQFTLGNTYDLVVAHGGLQMKIAKQAKQNGAHIVYFSSGSYWKYHNDAEKRRFKYFSQRHGVKLPYDRLITQGEEEINQLADAIICLGNEVVRQTYHKFAYVYSLNIATFAMKRALMQKKDWTQAKRHWLFFSGAGNIHKGLDLLLDAFKDSDAHLHIATRIDDGFGAYYKKSLTAPNIHLEGFVDIGSSEYFKLMNTCGIIVLPSSSEGSPGSVVDSMRFGLIPVLTKSAGIDTDGIGYQFKTDQLEDIRAMVQTVTHESPATLDALSKAVQDRVAIAYSQAHFEEELLKILTDIEKQVTP